MRTRCNDRDISELIASALGANSEHPIFGVYNR